MEFKEFSNPEERNYDITSSFRSESSSFDDDIKYQLIEMIGILEDINEEELFNNYGITLSEYFNPTEETIRKVSEKLESARSR